MSAVAITMHTGDMWLSLEEAAIRNLGRRGINVDWPEPDQADLLAEKVSHWWMNDWPISALPKLAQEELDRGWDSPARRKMAQGSSSGDADNERQLELVVADLMKEWNYPNSQEGGAELFYKLYLERVVQDLVPPYVGARSLAWVGGHRHYDEVPAHFLALVEKWDSSPEIRDQVDREIAGYARQVISTFAT